ncbi:hypothetical protein K1Y77_17195 (plasmid) [Halomonas qaidamensis]|uniref:Uncharacterized protein n=1 Tax=Halomonas qaidamensis TaxID=2866211 RepID=A0ABY6JWT4_9GAMM|nr:hypothetical protein [Halomonas qaidamensis]UYV20955.1 hypothetical protein K1Y77_17195 [Halomonas qaidamensis]
MPRPKQMNDNEVATWLAVLLDTAFDPAHDAVQQQGKAQLLALASDFTHYPDDFPDTRRAQLLLRWVSIWLPDDWWPRLQNRVRKRRSRVGAEKSDATNHG